MKFIFVLPLFCFVIAACGGGNDSTPKPITNPLPIIPNDPQPTPSPGNPTALKFSATLTVEIDENHTVGLMPPSVEGAEGAQLTFSFDQMEDFPDNTKFTIAPTTGEIQFKSAPDFEAPQDLDGDNIYNIAIRAVDSNSTPNRLANTQIQIKVLDVSKPAIELALPQWNSNMTTVGLWSQQDTFTIEGRLVDLEDNEIKVVESVQVNTASVPVAEQGTGFSHLLSIENGLNQVAISVVDEGGTIHSRDITVDNRGQWSMEKFVLDGKRNRLYGIDNFSGQIVVRQLNENTGFTVPYNSELFELVNDIVFNEEEDVLYLLGNKDLFALDLETYEFTRLWAGSSVQTRSHFAIDESSAMVYIVTRGKLLRVNVPESSVETVFGAADTDFRAGNVMLAFDQINKVLYSTDVSGRIQKTSVDQNTVEEFHKIDTTSRVTSMDIDNTGERLLISLADDSQFTQKENSIVALQLDSKLETRVLSSDMQNTNIDKINHARFSPDKTTVYYLDGRDRILKASLVPSENDAGPEIFTSSFIPAGGGASLPMESAIAASYFNEAQGLLYYAVSGMELFSLNPATGNRKLVFSNIDTNFRNLFVTNLQHPTAIYVTDDGSQAYAYSALYSAFWQLDLINNTQKLIQLGNDLRYVFIEKLEYDNESNELLVLTDVQYGDSNDFSTSVVAINPEQESFRIISSDTIGSGPNGSFFYGRGMAVRPETKILYFNSDNGILQVDLQSGDRSLVSGTIYQEDANFLSKGEGPEILLTEEIIVDVAPFIIVKTRNGMIRINTESGDREHMSRLSYSYKQSAPMPAFYEYLGRGLLGFKPSADPDRIFDTFIVAH